MNERARALELQLSLLKEAENDKNILAQCYLLNYTGATYLNSGRPVDGRDRWLKALQLVRQHPSQELNEIETVLHSNLMLYYYGLLDSARNIPMKDSFLYYVNRTITESRDRQVYWVLASALAYRGDYYGRLGLQQQGEQDIREAISLRARIGDPLYTTNDLIRLATFYLYQKQYDSSISILHQAMTEMKRGHLTEPNLQVLGLLSLVYKTKGDFKAYSGALEKFILDADTANRLNAADKIAAITTRYDVQKKEATIIKQQLQLAQRLNYVIATLLLVAISIPIVIVYIRRQNKKQRLKNETAVKDAEEKERKRIAAELHDNIGVQANAILHNSSLLNGGEQDTDRLLNNLQETARDMLGNLRETVWALKKSDATCAETWLRLVNFVKQVKRNFEDIRFDIKGDNPGELPIASVKALHVIMVVKEAVNNAVKHAGASDIQVLSRYEEEWTIVVSDNGKGFDSSALQGNIDSNGLANMQERAGAGQFKIDLHSIPHAGTCIILTIPV